MTIQGVRTSSAPLIGTQTQDTTSSRPTRTRTNTSETRYERPALQDEILVSTATAAEISEPNADGDPIVRAGWIEMRLAKIQRINQLITRLEAMGNSNDAQYRALHDRLTRAKADLGDEDALTDELATYEELGLRPEDDLDGNGVANATVNMSTGAVRMLSRDTDGDGLTDDYEDRLGTDRYATDSDGDRLSDYDEIRLSQLAGLENLDPTRADSLREGVIDYLALPRRVQLDLNENSGGSQTGGGTSRTGGTSGTTNGRSTTGVQSQSEELLWPRAQESQIYRASGDITFRKNGRDLIVNDRTYSNFFDENGRPNQRLYIQGTVGNVTYYNIRQSDLAGIADEDGVTARAGVRFETAPASDRVNTVVDLFNGSVPMRVNGNEIVYESSGINSQVQIPERIDGQEVKQVTVRQDGNDIVFDCKNARGQTLKSFRLRESVDEVTSGQISFKLADNGQLFDFTDGIATVEGGNGNDLIKIGAGTANGGRGNDVLSASYSDSSNPVASRGVTFRGGEGDDMLVGAEGTDHLYGDAGADLILSGGGQQSNDDLLGGAGADIIIGQNATGNYNIDGGGDTDISNITGTRARSIEIGPSQAGEIRRRVQTLLETHGISADRRERLEEVLDTNDVGGIMSANSIRDVMLSYSNSRMSGLEEEMGITHAGDIPPLPTERQNNPGNGNPGR